MQKNLRCHVLWVMGFLLFHLGALAQTVTVTGIVTAVSDNMPLPGVNVIIKGQTKGTVTDADGKYSIAAAASDLLVFSFIGMETTEREVGASTSIDVALTESLANLGEVVVVAYGTQKKSNVTGAVSNVDVEKTLGSRPVTDVGRALQGTTPGLIVTTTSGALGGSPTLRIRGNTSTIGGGVGDPLVLVDNVEVPDLSYVNPDDIESISVLKDASTTAVYGARAAFGAILITTKKGSTDGRMNIAYSNNFGWATPTNIPRQSRADLNLQYSWDQQAATRTTMPAEVGQVGYYYSPDVIAKVKNWIDTYGDGADLGREMVEGRDFDYRTAGGIYYYRPWDVHSMYYKEWTPQQTQNLRLSGGNAKTQYSFSGAFMNQKGVLNLFDDSYRRLNASGFVSTKAKDWLTVRGGLMLGNTKEISPFLYTSAVYDPQYYLYRWHPVYPYGTFQGKEFRGAVNELKSARPEDNRNNYTRYTVGTTIEFVPGLTATLDYTRNNNVETLDRVGGYLSGINQWNVSAGANPPARLEDLMGIYSTATYDFAQTTTGTRIRNTYNGYLTFEKVYGAHYVKAMGGTNIEDSEYKYISARRNGVFDFDKGEVNLAGGDQVVTTTHSWWSVAGFFGRINYGYKDRYLLEVNGRYDGSSRFAKDERWGFFPSASAAWRISEEPWMQSLQPVLSSAKIRASYGAVGNQDVPLSAYIGTIPVTSPTVTANGHWLVNNAYVPYIASSATATNAPALVDPSLTWETVTTLDFGLDAGFFHDKLGLTADWYNRKTSDMLTSGESLPASVGAAAPRRNFGELTTKGIEVALDYRHTFGNGLKLSLSAQYTDYQTVITKYPVQGEALNSANYWEGKRMGEIWGYRTEGLFQRDDFVWESETAIKQTPDKNGILRNTMAPGVPDQYILETVPNSFKFRPGDVRYADLNGDGVIGFGSNTVDDPGDRTVIGNTTPRYQYGFRAGAEWKGFDLSVFFQGVGKREIWATGNMVLPGYYGVEANFDHTLDYWTPENTSAFYPRPVDHAQTVRWNYNINDRYLLNAAYLRMKNLTVGYTVPAALSGRIRIQKARIYFSGENLFEFDKMGNVPIDPEIDWTADNLLDSRSFGRTYPYRRVLSFGLQLQF